MKKKVLITSGIIVFLAGAGYFTYKVIKEAKRQISEMQEVNEKEKKVLKEQLEAYPLSRHFDVARIIVDQAVRLGMANDDLAGIYPQWQEINDYGAEVQAHVIDKY